MQHRKSYHVLTWRRNQRSPGAKKVCLFIVVKQSDVVFPENIRGTCSGARKVKSTCNFFPLPVLYYLYKNVSCG